MAQLAQIELQAGADRTYRVLLWAVWGLAALTTAQYLRDLLWPLQLLAMGLLVSFWPGFVRRSETVCRLRLYRDGSAEWRGQRCTWLPHSRASRMGLVVRICRPDRVEHILVLASRNHTSDFRHLLVWNRFPPFGPLA